MQRAEHPLRQFDADFTRAENRAIGLLQDQAQTPGGEQRIQRALVEMPYQHPFHQHSERPGRDEGQYHREEEVAGEQSGKIGLEEIRGHPGDVGAEDHELAMGHVDDAHLAEDDRKTERHQHVDGKQDQAREALHDEDGAEIANRIIAEHRCSPSGKGPASRVKFATRGSWTRIDDPRQGAVAEGKACGSALRVLTGSPSGTDPARPDRRFRRSARTGHRAWRDRRGSSTRDDGFRGCGRNLPAHP